MKKFQILLTNDDGIQSPGLWAAAEALSPLGYVHVVAPREQYSGAGRSLPSNSDGAVCPKQVQVNGKEWTVYSVGGSPAQTVLHAALEIVPVPLDLAVSGINYGENVGTGITASGTVGAALEAAGLGIPALAVSLETDVAHHLSHSSEVDFSAAAYFTLHFARLLLSRRLPADVQVLKVDVPRDATADTPWETTRLSPLQYFESVPPPPRDWGQSGLVGYRVMSHPEQDRPDTDIYALRVRRTVAVTPLSLDFTSRVGLDDFDDLLRGETKSQP